MTGDLSKMPNLLKVWRWKTVIVINWSLRDLKQNICLEIKYIIKIPLEAIFTEQAPRRLTILTCRPICIMIFSSDTRVFIWVAFLEDFSIFTATVVLDSPEMRSTAVALKTLPKAPEPKRLSEILTGYYLLNERSFIKMGFKVAMLIKLR